jgi:prolyl 4-hydroxylase
VGRHVFFADMEQTFLQRSHLSVQPKEGMALAFMHSIWHEGAVVRNGKKYVLRTDVMYKQVSKI